MRLVGPEPSPELLAERVGLIFEIRESFAGVSREGGTSWREATALEDDASEEDPQIETDSGWPSLLDDATWRPDESIARWGLLDAKGFGFYLPVAMIRALVSGEGRAICWWLTAPLTGDGDAWRQKWSKLDLRQIECVRRFLEHMARRPGQDDWQEAFESYWSKV